MLSLPPLIFALAGVDRLRLRAVQRRRRSTRCSDARHRPVLAGAHRRRVNEVIAPTINDVLARGRFDVISIGFVLALWSGSRALNVFVDTITIMYGLGGHRGIVRTRALSFMLYVVATDHRRHRHPAGARRARRCSAGCCRSRSTSSTRLYWPVASCCLCFSLTTLYHVSVPVRTPWSSTCPGALLTLLSGSLGSFVLRWILTISVGGTSIYGPLARRSWCCSGCTCSRSPC